jgi:hypothetical protein
MDSNPKRKYTVSAKVVAANRENLKKALTARKPPPPPRRRAWNCRSIIGVARHAGRKAAATLKRQRQRLVEVLQPKDELQAKLAQGAADWLGRGGGRTRRRPSNWRGN